MTPFVRVLLESLAIASAGMLSVGSITIVILLLTSDRGLRSSVAYVLGYVGAYALIGVAVVLLGYDAANRGSSSGSPVSSAATVGFGVLLLWLAYRNWKRPPAERQGSPRLFSVLDKITPLRALAFGAIVTVLNVKNLAIFITAVSVPLRSDLALLEQVGVVLLVVLVFCAAVILPVVLYVSFPQGANELLLRFKQTLEAYSRPIGIWVPALFGLLFVVRGLTGLL